MDYKKMYTRCFNSKNPQLQTLDDTKRRRRQLKCEKFKPFNKPKEFVARM